MYLYVSHECVSKALHALKDKLEYTKGFIRSRNLKDRQYNGPDQDEKTNNGPQSTS
jgi:hypothetical protein